MTKKVTLENWNYHVLMLNEAMIGSISPNFRLVILFLDSDDWVVRFYLEEEIEEDIEEIEEIICQYDGGRDFTLGLGCRIQTIFGSKDIQFPSEKYRIAFRRRE